MRITFLGPSPNHIKLAPIGDFLKNWLRSGDIEKKTLRLAVAFADDSFLDVIRDNLEKFVSDGGTIQAIVGIDCKGTSRGALDTLLRIAGKSNVFVYQNPADGTFHPKLFILSEPRTRQIIIGSSNLTLGGLSNNFELSTCLLLEIRKKEDREIMRLFDDLFNGIKSSPSSNELTEELLLQLVAKNVLKTKDVRGFKRDTASKNPVRRLFKSTPQKHTRSTAKSTKAPQASPKGPRFLMSLASNDLSYPKRSDPYFLIPVSARDQDPNFWGWKAKFGKSKRARFEERHFKTIITIAESKQIENCRLYYIPGLDEFRFRCKSIYSLGSSYVGSFVEIFWTGQTRNIANVVLIKKGTPQFRKIAKLPFNTHHAGKKWIYES